MAKSKALVDILAKQTTKKNEEWKDKLLAQCFHNRDQGESFRSLNMEKFNNAYLYYTAQLPANTQKDNDTLKVGHKEYVEPVLFNAVKSALPQLLDSFTTDDSLAVAFRNRGFRKNPIVEELVNYNINKIFLRDQNGYSILENAFKEILIAGDAFFKVFVDETTHKEQASVEDWIELSAFMAELAEGWNIEPVKGFLDGSGSKGAFEWKEEKHKGQNPQTGEPVEQVIYFVRGKIPLMQIDNKLIIEQCEPNDLWFDISYGNDFDKCRYICHRVQTTVGEALLRGFDEEAIKNAADVRTDDTQLPELFFSATMYQNPNFAQNNRLDRGVSTDPNERPICLYEHYIYSSFPNKKGETRKYQVTTTDSEFLKVEEIKHFPFVHGQGEPVQGQFFGRSFFDICKPYQDSLSLAQRMQEQVAIKTTWPQYAAVKGQYDRQSLLNNRAGAVIEQNQPGMVERFAPLSLDQSFALATQSLKDSMKETVAQSIDLMSEAGTIPQIATQTAYVSLYQQALKGKSLTNNIKNTLVQPLMCKIYEIVKDEGFTLYAPDGSTVSGVELPNVYDFIIDTNTTQDDFAQNMQITNVAGFVLQASQVNSPIITPQNLYNIAKDMLEKSDIDSSKYLSDPSQMPQDPQAQRYAAEAKYIESERHRITLQTEILNMWKVGSEVQVNLSKAESETLNAHNKVSKDQSDAAHKLQKLLTEAKSKYDEIQVKAQEVAVKNKAVNYETILAANKHATDITAPNVNGVR